MTSSVGGNTKKSNRSSFGVRVARADCSAPLQKHGAICHFWGERSTKINGGPTMRKFPIIAVIAGAVAVPLLVLLAFTFIRPYDVPEFVEVDSSESAFLIPLEGDTTNQAAFHSVKFLEEKKIATKRVQITHRWQQMGYLPRSGNYVATVRLVKVDRRPITREWTKSPKTGTSSKDEAIAVESKESVNFSMGLSCTAHIPEESAAVFLYRYPSKSLS